MKHQDRTKEIHALLRQPTALEITVFAVVYLVFASALLAFITKAARVGPAEAYWSGIVWLVMLHATVFCYILVMRHRALKFTRELAKLQSALLRLNRSNFPELEALSDEIADKVANLHTLTKQGPTDMLDPNFDKAYLLRTAAKAELSQAQEDFATIHTGYIRLGLMQPSDTITDSPAPVLSELQRSG